MANGRGDFIPLVHHTGRDPTYLNPSSIISVSEWKSGKSEGASLKLPDGTIFRTDTSVADILSMLARDH